MKNYLLMIILTSSVFAQGEYFNNGESGLIVGRVYVFNRIDTLYGTGFGLSFNGRVDVSIVTRDLEPIFGGLTAYAITGHLLKQTSDSTDPFPFSFAVSLSQASRFRSYSFIPYISIPFGNNFSCIAHAGLVVTNGLGTGGGYNEQGTSLTSGVSLKGTIFERINLILESGALIGNMYPSFGLSLLVGVKLF